ncbi:hypothetical protein JK636_19860 [Clostridium sp. YIM B02515]|uniref:Uncharacterized protein n=1 Tax=Clostridium rhizosphaerae TaxID=2803861 RepID=A0ABS1TF47_9CLOT|nr:hypothetical protein [Clostridium rhizosphaerae]MBL4937970.1 hypothetical protein [Clostridium rhizosphaerae]
MGIGYVLGCLLSIVIWKLDRQNLFYKINKFISKGLKSKLLLEILYTLITGIICYAVYIVKPGEIINFIIIFLVIDISNTEKKNLKQREKVKFYDTISTISRALVCGFIAPVMLILLAGNCFGLAYMIIYNLSIQDEQFYFLKYVFILLTIIPAVIAEVFLYIVYLCRNRKSEIDFKGDYLSNFLKRPLLNVDIMGAYVESVNFYYMYSSQKTDYLKSYGGYSKKIDNICVKDYLSITYGICIIVFILFYLLIK